MATNEFLTFCPDDTGTNLTDLGDYAVDADRESGNKPGVARSALTNRALRQANLISSQFAQYMSDKLGANVLDEDTQTRLLAQVNALLYPLAPQVTRYTSGSGTHNKSYVFFIASGNASAAATYTNNTFTFTVKTTVAAGLQLVCTGTGAPAASGVLTKATGSGDATITFYAVRLPVYYRVQVVGGGGGGAGGNAGGAGGAGGNSTFGSSFLTANGGAANGGAGGSATGGDVNITGGRGNSGSASSSATPAHSSGGGSGGSNPLGGAGSLVYAGAGLTAAANSGGGGGGGGTDASGTLQAGSGGSAGGFVEKIVASPDATYAYAVGAAGSAGAAGSNASDGSVGAAGAILVEEFFQ